MGWTDDLLGGIAGHLDAQAIVAWHPDSSPYAVTETGVYRGNLPPTPDQVVGLTCYSQPESDGLGDVTAAVQVRVRGTTDPRTADDTADAIHEALDGLRRVQLGGIWVEQIYHQSSAYLGVDSNDRHERTINFYVQARRATALRSD